MTGTTIAQAIPIAISPILTRLFTPEDFGVVALYVSISSIIASVATGKYELAIMLPKKDEDAATIAALSTGITLIFSILTLIIVSFFNQQLTSLLGNTEISVWLYVIPLSVLLTGVYQSLNYWLNRKKQYKKLAGNKIIASSSTASTKLVSGYFSYGSGGLIISNLFGQAVATTILFGLVWKKSNNLFKEIRLSKLFILARKYAEFPKYTLASTLANTLALQLINIFISVFYSVSTLGFYSLVQRIMGIPSTLIGISFGQVFFQQASEEKKQTGTAIKTFKSTLKKLVITAVPMFLILFFVVEELFAFVFGEEWRISGVYAKAIMPLFFIRFIVSPITTIILIYLKNKLLLLWQIGLLLLFVSIFLIGNFFEIEFVSILYLISVLIGAYYLVLLYLIYSFIKRDTIK